MLNQFIHWKLNFLLKFTLMNFKEYNMFNFKR